MVAEWVYEPLQIQVAESHNTFLFRIPLGTCNYDGEIVTKKQLYPVLFYSIYSYGAHSAASNALIGL